ncbi:MAG: hypothetical protein HY674_16370 [Chloroflexi bacterium]|nr:hypothetical protein [Chloroflexota bacterium]
MQALHFEEALSKIIALDPRYHQEAYVFVREALDYSQKSISKISRSQPRHVTGRELLEGIREYGLLKYGPMTSMLFEDWGVRQCEDFGEIVFNMVEHGLLSKTESDSREDFKGGYDFFDAFRRPFLPAKIACAPAPEPKSSQS